MKVSNGFISNSSSSSFILYGFELDNASWSDIAKEHFPKIYEECVEEDILDDDYEIRSKIFEDINKNSKGELDYLSEENLFGFRIASDVENIGLKSLSISKLLEYEETLKQISKKLFGKSEIESKLYYGSESC